jgi:tetratricopeptide (TPR) repeat protein
MDRNMNTRYLFEDLKSGTIKRRLVFFLVVVLLILPLRAKENRLRHLYQGIETVRRAYLRWDADGFTNAVRYFKRAKTADPADYRAYYWQGVGYFYLTSFYLFGLPHHRDKKKARRVVDEAIDALKMAVKRKPDDSESHALLGTLMGIKIYLSPAHAFLYGPSVQRHLVKAHRLDSQNPRVYYLSGVSYYHSPKLLGGGADKALRYLKKAQTFYVKEYSRRARISSLKPRWGYSTCLAFLGKAYRKTGAPEKAKTALRRALVIAPSDPLAKRELSQMNGDTD